ncbi:long-chain-fatty-acid--CoA ligase [Demetria terragena]|uniref:long-chain-fatty-acid--CoA ligase n=1 Tax=Demetria terragena TaxID=63959 RepID=UPI00036D948F|nr:long-chain fatty acid--CoA ligase [Demetria terragena]
MNVAEFVTSSAQKRPDHPALRLGEFTQSYAELDEATARVATLLGTLGHKPGDSVGMTLPNVPEFAAIYYGILRAGGVVIPMNPLLKGREVAYFLEDSDARILFSANTFIAEAKEGAEQTGATVVEVVPGEFASVLQDHEPATGMVDRDPSDTAVLLYTSGTTGRPKGAELTHSNLGRNAEIVRDTVITLTDEDIILGGLPLFHAFGQTVTLNAGMAAGATLVLLPRFEPTEALQTMAAQKTTIFAGVPTMYAAMLGVSDAPALPNLRQCASGGASLPVEVLRRFEEAFGCKILEGYGLSETSPVASFNHPHLERKAGSIGTPLQDVEMRIVDDNGEVVAQGERGEIAVKGHNIMKGYRGRAEATAEVLSEDGWFRTGDIGIVDEDGYYFVVDRKKDLVIRGGYNVYPREIEEVLYEHPAIAEAAVVGIPHDSLGEEVGAAVAFRAGESATEDEVREFVKERVAAYKYPRVVWVVDELPKGPTGKILKREITLPETQKDA